MNQRLTHDAAFPFVISIMECIENCIRPEERKGAFDAIYCRVHACIEAYEQHKNRQEIRLCRKQSKN